MLEHPELHDVERVIEGARHVGEGRAGDVVERPVAGVEVAKPIAQRAQRLLPSLPRSLAAGVEPVVVEPPGGPHHPVQDVGGRVDDHLLQPQISALVRVDHSAPDHLVEEGLEHVLGGLEVTRIVGGAMRAREQRQPLALCERGVPAVGEQGLILPLEEMRPHVQAGGVGLEAREQPLGRPQEALAPRAVAGT